MATKLIIITGLPATGKTTIGKYLAEQLNYVFLSKDALKESLFDSLGVKDRAWSQDLGKASFSLLYLLLDELLKKQFCVVVETNFVSEYDSSIFQELIHSYRPEVKQILCFADGEVLYERFIKRASLEERHVGHNDSESVFEHKARLLAGKAKSLDIDCPLIEIDTTKWKDVDLDTIVCQVQ